MEKQQLKRPLVPQQTTSTQQKTEVLSSIPPNHTLYIRGLNEKISKKQLKHLLYCLFSQFGQVLDVVALKTIKMRGQAFVVFGRIEEATMAMRSLQSYPFLDNPLVYFLVQDIIE